MPRTTHARASFCSRPLTFALLAGAAVGALAPLPVKSDPGDGNYYFFGDSAMGQGNYSAIIGEGGEDHFPYSSNNGFARESNGLVWTEMLGRDVDIILDPQGTSSNINFAISGAHMTRGGDLTNFGIETGVKVQTELFGTLVGDGSLDISGDDVAFVVAGANDFLDRLDAGDAAEDIMVDVAQAAAANVAAIAETGIKTIVLSEIQPLQYAPGFADALEVRAELTDLMFASNELMLASVAAQGLSPDVNIVTMKYEAMVAHMRSNAQGLGFTEITTPCFDDDAETLCSTDAEVQNQHIFFDDLHFSEGAHALAAQWWGATLSAATGEATREAGRIPAVFQYEMESSLRRFGLSRQSIGDIGRVSFFTDFVYDTPTLDGRSDDPSVKVRTIGGLWGGELAITDSLSAGLAYRFTDTKGTFETGGRFDGDTHAVHGWIGYDPGFAAFELSSAYGWIDVDDIQRPTGVDLLTARADSKGRFWTVGLTASKNQTFEWLTVDTAIGIHSSELQIDDYQETGAIGLNLQMGQQTLKSTRLQLDWGMKGKAFSLGEAMRIQPVLDLNYRYEFKEDGHIIGARLLDNTANASFVRAGGVSKHRLSASAGADMMLGERWRLGARYERTFASDVSSADAVRITARFSF